MTPMAGQDGCGAAAGVLRVVGTGTNTNEQDPVATVINYIHPRNVCVCTPHRTLPTHPGVNQGPVR